jgi:hypothetical protein
MVAIELPAGGRLFIVTLIFSFGGGKVNRPAASSSNKSAGLSPAISLHGYLFFASKRKIAR